MLILDINLNGIRIWDMHRLKRIVTWIVSIMLFSAISKTVGIFSIIVPAVLILISYVITDMYISSNKKPFYPSYSFILGHILWFCLGIIIGFSLKNKYESVNHIWEHFDVSVFIDIVVYSLLLIWLIKRPGLFSGIATLIFVCLEIVFLSIMVSETYDDIIVVSHTLNIALYAMTFISLIYGIVVYRKNNIAPKGEIINSPTGISP